MEMRKFKISIIFLQLEWRYMMSAIALILIDYARIFVAFENYNLQLLTAKLPIEITLFLLKKQLSSAKLNEKPEFFSVPNSLF